jgi:hypothetical protein
MRAHFEQATLAPQRKAELLCLVAQRWFNSTKGCGFIALENGAPAAEWFKLVGAKLGNGNEEYPDGDNVQTVEPPPTLMSVEADALSTVLDVIDAGATLLE